MIRIAIILILALSSCTDVRHFSSYSTYEMIENSDDCEPIDNDTSGKIKVNTKFGFVKANVFGEYKKFEIDSYKYHYRFMAIFKKKKDRKSISITCTNGYEFHIIYGRFCVLNMPDDGDEDYCDAKIFYDL